MRIFAHKQAAARPSRSPRPSCATPALAPALRTAPDVLDSKRAGVPEIQRKVTTLGGDWDTVRYQEDQDRSNRGLDIVLKFAPDTKAVNHPTTIGLVQSARSRRQGHVTFIPGKHGAAARDRAIERSEARKMPGGGTDEGYHLDQQADAKSPFYAAGAYKAGDTAATVHKTGTTASRHAKVEKVKGKLKASPAYLKDTPGLSLAEEDSGQHFEVAALAIDGALAGTYYGSVTYGWETDAQRNFTKLPLRLKSPSVPSSTFLKTARLWNKDGLERFQLQVPDVFVATDDVLFYPVAKRGRKRRKKRAGLLLARGTRVVYRWPDTPPSLGSATWDVEVVNGPHAGRVGRVDASKLEHEETRRPSK